MLRKLLLLKTNIRVHTYKIHTQKVLRLNTKLMKCFKATTAVLKKSAVFLAVLDNILSSEKNKSSCFSSPNRFFLSLVI